MLILWTPAISWLTDKGHAQHNLPVTRDQLLIEILFILIDIVK